MESRHSGVHFFDISTSKSGPNMSEPVSFFCTFHLETRFAPQRRALFRHLNFQKWSEHVRTWCVLYMLTWKRASRHNVVHFFGISTSKSGLSMVCLFILTWKCASHHNGVQLFISHLARWLRTRRFSEPTFRPSGATNHWENTCFATMLPFRAPATSFF